GRPSVRNVSVIVSRSMTATFWLPCSPLPYDSREPSGAHCGSHSSSGLWVMRTGAVVVCAVAAAPPRLSSSEQKRGTWFLRRRMEGEWSGGRCMLIPHRTDRHAPRFGLIRGGEAEVVEVVRE